MKSTSKLSRMLMASLGTPLALAFVIGFTTPPTVSAQDKDSKMKSMKAMKGRITLMAEPQTSGLQNATGYAEVNSQRGTVTLSVTLAEGTQLPAGTVLEGWLSSAGRKGGPGMTTASESDQKFGPAFGKEEVAMTSRDIPYALSTGVLKRKGTSRTYVGTFQIDNSLAPYGAVAVTLESDGNTGSYDPRPGSPFMSGMIAKDAMMRAAK